MLYLYYLDVVLTILCASDLLSLCKLIKRIKQKNLYFSFIFCWLCINSIQLLLLLLLLFFFITIQCTYKHYVQTKEKKNRWKIKASHLFPLLFQLFRSMIYFCSVYLFFFVKFFYNQRQYHHLFQYISIVCCCCFFFCRYFSSAYYYMFFYRITVFVSQKQR